jgi:uncharacterized protein YkwD
LLAACGGGGTTDSSSTATAAATTLTTTSATGLQQQPGAPAQTGDTATDGFNWINYRRVQAGLPALTRNSLIDAAALAHSNYQKTNNVVTHTEVAGNPGFTGATLLDRFTTAGYVFGAASYAYGEVISATTDSSGFTAAEGLITAIYHRFVIFEPVFKESGAGAAATAGGYTYFTDDFAANNGYGPGVGSGNIAVYPFAGQTKVPVNFFSDNESPDPVPNQNEVGYPISVHADISGSIAVTSFTVRQHGAASDLPVRLLTNAADADTPLSAAAIIPLAVLSAGTTYDVSFTGTVSSVSVTRNWSFTTQ